METHEVRFEKVVGGGNALGYIEGLPCFTVGPLPGELVEVRTIKQKSGSIEAAVVRIIEPHESRSPAAEEHYLACSPWQGVGYAYQLDIKRGMIEDAFARQPLEIEIPAVVAADKQAGYRNKVEFSLTKNSSGRYELAFHERGSYEGRLPAAAGCSLASEHMNTAAIRVAGELDRLNMAGGVETILVRESLSAAKVLVLVGLKEKIKFDWSQLTVLPDEIVSVGHLTGRNVHKVDWASHKPELVERVGGVDLTFRYSSFFQTNIAVFEKLLAEILARVPAGGQVLDLYGGVGTIGLALAARGDHVLGVELDIQSSEIAQANAVRAGISTYEAYAAGAERLDGAVFQGMDTVVVDPPRAGLDRRVIDALLDARPERIIYVSCNVVTQARDWAKLREQYEAVSMRGYDMYPGTLHLESLLVLQRKTS